MKSNMRRLIIDKLLTENEYVPFEQMQAVLKMSAPTIKRDLRFMREELKAPIRFSYLHGGYTYLSRNGENEAQETIGENPRLPFRPKAPLQRRQWYSPEELFVLATAYDLLGSVEDEKDSALSEEIAPLRARVLSLFNLGGVQPLELAERVRIIDRRLPCREPQTFETIGCALCEKRRVRIRYFSRKTGETSVREISPARLVHYRGGWYVDAFCHQAGEMRTFLIENIRSAEVLPIAAKARLSADRVAAELDAGYGIFHGRNLKMARMHVRADTVPYVKREPWHPAQEIRMQKDGSAELLVPYYEPTELTGEILRWGRGVEVLEPQELREHVRKEAAGITALYASGTESGD